MKSWIESFMKRKDPLIEKSFTFQLQKYFLVVRVMLYIDEYRAYA